MFRVILIVIGIIILYKLIFDFIIPVYRTTRDLKKRFRDIHQQSAENLHQYGQGNPFGQTTAGPQREARREKPKDKDYIEFEEVK
ncbi:MAG TPA: hypothetical protein VGD17_06515 [Chitinophagaceae bacterium]